jgi:hypothetical protein
LVAAYLLAPANNLPGLGDGESGLVASALRDSHGDSHSQKYLRNVCSTAGASCAILNRVAQIRACASRVTQSQIARHGEKNDCSRTVY